jgi:multisubunit Na+/H+ antiporter MnhF subunit
LFHGDIIGALDYNAMLPFFAVFVGFGLIAMIYYAVKGSRIPVNILKPNVLWVFLVTLMVFGALRNLPWYPFSVLFP